MNLRHQFAPTVRVLVNILFSLMVFPLAAAPPAQAPADIGFGSDGVTLSWSPVAAATAYHVYRGTSPGAADPLCRLFQVETVSAQLPEINPAGNGLFYFLITAVNLDGEGPFGPSSTQPARPNNNRCLDGDGDLAPDNLDNCPATANLNQADQNRNGTGDRCDPVTYDFEADVAGTRPAAMTQLGGIDASFLVRDAGGDLGVSYNAGNGVHDRFSRLTAGMPHQNSTVYIDYAETADALSVELWSDGAFGWNAGNGIIFQVRDTGQIWFYDRHRGAVPGLAGPFVPPGGRLRLRLLKLAGDSSALPVDCWNGQSWNDDLAVFPVEDDHRYDGLDIVVADYWSGRRVLTRVTAEHVVPADTLSVRKHPSWSSDWKVFQQDATGQATVPVRFYYNLEEPGTAQVRLVRASNGQPLPGFDWIDHELALPVASGGSGESALAAVPAGGNYNVEVRISRDSDGMIMGTGSIDQIGVGEVFLAGGQSNMTGSSGTLANAEQPIDEVHLFHNDGHWKIASEPMDDGVDQVDGISAESPTHSLMLAFAKNLHQALGIPVGIIPGPLGGTNLHTQWQRNAAVHDARNTLYGSLLHRGLLQNFETPPRGFLWYQGESDNGRGTVLYRMDMERLMAQYREDLNHPELHFLIAQLATAAFTDLEGWMEIKEAHRQVALADPRAAMIVTQDQPRADTVHLNVAGYKVVGARFGEAAREMIYGEFLDAQTNLVGTRRLGNGRQIELTYDADVSGGDPALFRAIDSRGVKVVRTVTVSGNLVTLDLEHRVSGEAFISYGYSVLPASQWLRDLRGVAVPAFQMIAVP